MGELERLGRLRAGTRVRIIEMQQSAPISLLPPHFQPGGEALALILRTEIGVYLLTLISAAGMNW